MRRTLAALEVSLWMWNRPISAVARTWVPPHSSREYVLALADLHHAHDLAVLLAEQRHRAETAGLLQRGRDRAHRVVGEDPLVHAVLDVAQLLGAQRRGVAEVEAQLVGADVGAGLAHVLAEALAQRGVQQVRGGVVALGRVAGGVVDAGEHGLVGVELPLLQTTTSSTWSSPRRKTFSTRARQPPSSHSIGRRLRPGRRRRGRKGTRRA